MIGVIDYGMGNLRSVENSLRILNIPYCISKEINELEQCRGLILPGVGAFKDAMDNLNSRGLIKGISSLVKKGIPLLGICLGMQVLFEEGQEGETCKGLGFIKGKIVKMEGDFLRIPQIGWNSLEGIKDIPILKGIDEEEFVYFVHSYYGVDYEDKDLAAYSIYGELKIPAVVWKENVYGTQFHPEKSSTTGLKIIKNFGEMIK